MANPTKRYAGVPGFNIKNDDAPAPNNPPLERSLIDNHELITDLARFSEGQPLCTESTIRKKWRLSEDTWELLGDSDEMIRAIEEEKARRVRSKATQREFAQTHLTRGPNVLASIMDDPTANARHRVDSIKALNAIADPGPQAAAERERIFIRIDLSADTKDPKDVLTFEATPRPSNPG